MNRMRRILSFIQAVVLMLSIMPINMTVRASATVIEADTQTPSQPTTILADDARIHRSSDGTNAPKMEDGEYQIGRAIGNLIYDRDNANRKVKPCLYNFRELMTNTIGTSTDKGINRYPYVVIKVNAPEAGYYDLGVTLNANPSSLVDSAAIVVDGFMHIVNLSKPYNTKQTLTVEDVYLTQGEHTIMYTAVLPENENEVVTNDLCYPWTNFWSFTFGAGLEVLDASSLTGADVENIMKQPNRIEAEDTRFASWNIYSKTEAYDAASGDTVVGGPAYAQCQQTFADLTVNGLDQAKTPYLQYTVEAPVAGTYYVTIGAYVGTSTNNSNPVPYVAVIANDNAPVKAQFDGVWNQFDSVTVAVQLQKGVNLIRCTSVTPDQYSTGTAWVNQDYLEVQGTLTAMRTGVYAADSDNADYLYLSRYTDQDTKFGEPGNYADLRWDYPSLYEAMTGIYTKKDDGNTRWPYIAFKVNAPEDGEYRISAKIGASADAKTVGMIVDGATYVVDVTTASGWMRGTAHLSAGEHVIIFTSPMPRDIELAKGYVDSDRVRYPWMDYYAFELDGGLSFLEAPTFEDIQASMQNYSRVEAEDVSFAIAAGKYANETTKTYTRRNGQYTVTVKGTSGTVSDSDYVEYTVCAETAGTYVIRIGAYLEGEGTMPYGTILVNGTQYKAQFSGNWNGYDAVNLAVSLNAGENTIRCLGVSADQTETGGWIGYDFMDLPVGVKAEGEPKDEGDRKIVSATDDDCADYLYLSRYQDMGDKFADPGPGNTARPDLHWDYPSLYESMTGIYTKTNDGTKARWPYVAFRVNASEAGEYRISVKIATSADAKTIGMIVDGATHIVDVTATSGWMRGTAYLSQGEHVIVITTPIPRDMELAPEKNNALYPWMDYYAFKLDGGLSFLEAPTFEDIQASMQTYSRVEAEDISYAIAAGKYAQETTKTYTRIYGQYAVTVKGTPGAVSDSDYVEYKVWANAAGTYVIRIGAYLEGSGTMPYGTILVNGTQYKAQFSGNWNGYDAVNLSVQLQEGTNIIRCMGVSADQTETGGWIGYDFVDIPEGVQLVGDRKIISATDDDCADYLYLNEYKDTGSAFGGPNYDHMRWDYPSLYGDMLGIYSDAMPERAGYWPYIAFRVNAEEAGYYRLAATIERNTAVSLGMIVDGATYVVDVTSNEVSKSVYLTEGEHIVIFTAPIPRDMELVPEKNDALYPWMNYVSFKVDAGLNFGSKPTAADIQTSMQNYSRIEAEDLLYHVAYHADYSDYATKKYASRYDSEMTAVMGASGAVIDGKVSSAELKANSSQTFEQLSQGLAATTSYVEYAVNASKAGTYIIRVGAYIEGGGTVPYGTILVNGTAYKAQFAGNWNGYDVANIPVELQAGKNTIRCIGVTADQTNSGGWIGYDYLDIPNGVSAVKTGATLVHAGDENYVTFNNYKDQGDTLGSAHYLDLRWDRLSIDALNYAYLSRMPYAAVQVTAEKDGTYDIYFKSKFNPEAESQQIGILVDGVTAYPMTLSEFRSHASIKLTKGTHTLVFTTPMPATESAAANTKKFDSAAYPWMDMETFVIGAGLKVGKAPNKQSIENPNVTIEAEEYAMPNLDKITDTGVGSGVYLKAQTAAQIVKDGIDPTVTPYVEYMIDASEAGTYELYVALKIGTSATFTAGKMKCSFVVENGNTRQVKSVYAHQDTQGVIRVIPVTLKLDKGLNVVRMTHFTGDSVVDKAYVWNDFDYIQLSPAAAKKLTFLPTMVLEAEQASYTSYVEKIGTGYSGDTYLGDADYGYIDENQITFEALDVEDLGDLPRVTYLFEAEKAGTYTLSVKFNTGLINYKPEELDKIGFAMIVNGKDKQLVEFELASLQASTTRLFTVDLVEGENEITFTSTLADYMRSVKPRIEDTYRLVWVDHDALYLSYGLSIGREAERFGIEDSSVDRGQLKLLGLTDDAHHTPGTEGEGGTSGLTTTYIIIGVTACVVLVIFIIILAKKKKTEKSK